MEIAGVRIRRWEIVIYRNRVNKNTRLYSLTDAGITLFSRNLIALCEVVIMPL